MNTFFRICVYICLLLLIFNLVVVFVDSIGAFPVAESLGETGVTDTNALAKFTTLSGSPTMNTLIWSIISIGAIAAGVVSYLFKTATPVGVYLFSAVFWSMYYKTHTLVFTGGYIDPVFITIFTVAIIFVFIGALIGMLTGVG